MVISAANASLGVLLAECLPEPGAVRFSVPPAPAGQPAGPALHLILYDVREDPQGRLADWLDVRDAAGRVVGRRRPPRRYELSYLASAVANDIDEEHRLLGTALTGLHEHDHLPERCLRGALVATGRVALTVASPKPKVEPYGLWTAFGVPMRAAFDLMLTVAVPVGAAEAVTASPQRVNLGMTASG